MSIMISALEKYASVRSEDVIKARVLPYLRHFLGHPWCLVALGLALRAFHYLHDPSVWHDEIWMILNVLNKGFVDLLGPLNDAQSAPPLFLWTEKLASLTLGDSTYSLRLFPFVASCASLFLMHSICRQMERSVATSALLLFACSDTLMWHTCETKPYAIDVFVATGLCAVYCRTASWSLIRQLLIYSVLAPLGMLLSYPSSFLAATIVAVLLPAVWRENRLATWLGFMVLIIATCGVALLLLRGPIHAQSSEPPDSVLANGSSFSGLEPALVVALVDHCLVSRDHAIHQQAHWACVGAIGVDRDG
jgi:hypothetical protein